MNIFTVLAIFNATDKMYVKASNWIWISRKENVSFDYYVQMIGLKTSVLLREACSWVQCLAVRDGANPAASL